MAQINSHGASMCLSVCPVLALTFENLHLETSFFDVQLVRFCISRLSGQGQGHRSKKCGYILFAGSNL